MERFGSLEVISMSRPCASFISPFISLLYAFNTPLSTICFVSMRRGIVTVHWTASSGVTSTTLRGACPGFATACSPAFTSTEPNSFFTRTKPSITVNVEVPSSSTFMSRSVPRIPATDVGDLTSKEASLSLLRIQASPLFN